MSERQRTTTDLATRAPPLVVMAMGTHTVLSAVLHYITNLNVHRASRPDGTESSRLVKLCVQAPAVPSPLALPATLNKKCVCRCS